MVFEQKKHQAEIEEQRKKQEELFKQHDEEQSKKKKKKRLLVYSIIAVVILIILVYIANYYFMPGPYDPFAKCLTEKGAVMYGAIAWCQYTQAQAGMFGKSFKYINYQDESKLTGIKTRPTWVINGKWLEKVQSFEALSEVTGCQLK